MHNFTALRHGQGTTSYVKKCHEIYTTITTCLTLHTSTLVTMPFSALILLAERQEDHRDFLGNILGLGLTWSYLQKK